MQIGPPACDLKRGKGVEGAVAGHSIEDAGVKLQEIGWPWLSLEKHPLTGRPLQNNRLRLY